MRPPIHLTRAPASRRIAPPATTRPGGPAPRLHTMDRSSRSTAGATVVRGAVAPPATRWRATSTSSPVWCVTNTIRPRWTANTTGGPAIRTSARHASAAIRMAEVKIDAKGNRSSALGPVGHYSRRPGFGEHRSRAGYLRGGRILLHQQGTSGWASGGSSTSRPTSPSASWSKGIQPSRSEIK